MRFCLLFIFMISVIRVTGQDQSLIGYVVDESGSALKDVNIVNQSGRSTGTSSSINGRFTIVCHPGDTLIFSHLGFDSQKIGVQPEYFLATAHPLIVRLIPAPVPLKQVTISAKRDRRFQYLLDFEVVQSQIVRLEIKGRDKYLILTDTNNSEFWRCQLPGYMLDCNKLCRDFIGNAYLQSKDSLYQLKIDSRICEILPPVYQGRYHQVMDQCIGKTSTGIVTRNYGESNKSVSVWLVSRLGSKKIYEQEDKLALKYCRDLAGKSEVHAGLGFPVVSPELKSGRPGSQSERYILKGASSAFASQIMAQPISVESFCINDSIFVYDNTLNRMFILDKQGEVLLSSPIELNNPDFLNKYIVDDQAKLTYAVFRNRKGVYLQQIDYQTGKILGPAKKIDMHFYEKVRIVKNTAIYLNYDHIANSRSIIKTYL
jgi:hypothetical protein